MAFADGDELMKAKAPGDRMPRMLKELTADEVLDDWLHGCVVHGAPEKRQAVELWNPVPYQWSLVKAVSRSLKRC